MNHIELLRPPNMLCSWARRNEARCTIKEPQSPQMHNLPTSMEMEGMSGPGVPTPSWLTWKLEAANALGTGPRRCDLPNYTQGCMRRKAFVRMGRGACHSVASFRRSDTSPRSQSLEGGGRFHIAHTVGYQQYYPFFLSGRSWHRDIVFVGGHRATT
ncbi:hypothetical protein EDB86DRAFT_1491243 [Lactarius hatsudake]|nr:hypothetical protein EDB86DRAFT_1491243 [Lactarius hatsudake]